MVVDVGEGVARGDDALDAGQRGCEPLQLRLHGESDAGAAARDQRHEAQHLYHVAKALLRPQQYSAASQVLDTPPRRCGQSVFGMVGDLPPRLVQRPAVPEAAGAQVVLRHREPLLRGL